MKVAVVGAGIAGLSSAWLLNRKSGVEVSLFEAAHYLGGHSNTIDVELEGHSYPVDTGFLVHNPNTYPNLIAFLEKLNVKVVNSQMTFSVKLLGEKIEWAGTNIKTVFAQKKNIFSFKFWQMILDIIKFNKQAEVYLQESAKHHWTLGDLLKEKKYSMSFADWYLLPMGAAIWSTSRNEMMNFPASTFIQFGLNHSLFQVQDRPTWRTIERGAREYVKKIAAELKDVHLNEPVLEVYRGDKVKIKTQKGEYEFDKIIFATHADQTVQMIKDLDTHELSIIGDVKYSDNIAYLHTDETFLPEDKRIWSAWNYISEPAASPAVSLNTVCVSYLINELQPLPFKSPIIVTLNPAHAPKAEKIIKKLHYQHPQFDNKAIQAQEKLSEIQGKNHSYYAGAWCKYGFHEDGLNSGINVAKYFGVEVPWH